jgi:hypothetical protein
MPRSFSIEFIDLSARHRASADSAPDTNERLARADDTRREERDLQALHESTAGLVAAIDRKRC